MGCLIAQELDKILNLTRDTAHRFQFDARTEMLLSSEMGAGGAVGASRANSDTIHCPPFAVDMSFCSHGYGAALRSYVTESVR